VVVKDSVLNIRFSKGSADLPLISAIEVFAEDAFRINVAGSAYLSSKGWFLSDAYYGGGSVSAYAPGAVAGTKTMSSTAPTDTVLCSTTTCLPGQERFKLRSTSMNLLGKSSTRAGGLQNIQRQCRRRTKIVRV
jgi:hypothetical protein